MCYPRDVSYVSPVNFMVSIATKQGSPQENREDSENSIQDLEDFQLSIGPRPSLSSSENRKGGERDIHPSGFVKPCTNGILSLCRGLRSARGGLTNIRMLWLKCAKYIDI